MIEEKQKLTLEYCLLRHEKTKEITGVNYDLVAECVNQDAHFIHVIENKKSYLYSNGVYVGHADEILINVLYDLFSEYTDGNGQSIHIKPS